MLEPQPPGVAAIIIPDGAHHVDLMWSHPDDTPATRAARRLEMEHVAQWVAAHRLRRNAAGAAAS